MKTVLSFDDVLIVPKFSFIRSRQDVTTSQSLCGMDLRFPVISSNMDTVTGPVMARAMWENGAVGALHRFTSIEDNVKMFKESGRCMVSVGLGQKELERAKALAEAGADVFIVDVAHGASISVVEQVKKLRNLLSSNVALVVGNFATGRSILDFEYHLGNYSDVDAYKANVGSGSACLTRVVTGCGLPTFSSLMDCVASNRNIIADGGIKNSGDVAKALGSGAKAVMVGRMLAGTDESPGRIVSRTDSIDTVLTEEWNKYKKYRGSASTESYEVQGKIAPHRSYEGDSFLVPYVGPVKQVLEQLNGGLRSAMSYVGANNLDEFRENVEFVCTTWSGAKESEAHGKKL